MKNNNLQRNKDRIKTILQLLPIFGLMILVCLGYKWAIIMTLILVVLVILFYGYMLHSMIKFIDEIDKSVNDFLKEMKERNKE